MSRPVTYLDRILDAHRRAAADDPRRLDALLDEAKVVPHRPRGFRATLAGQAPGPGHERDVAVIAELKRRSPSKGDLAADLDPAELARSYVAGGAACLSVLTDVDFFAGSAYDLRAARAATAVPVLRKDFTVGPADVCDARIMGADAVLLIVAALDDAELADLSALAVELGLDALVEVHDEAELERALAVDADLIGVNQRDLVTFEVDRDRAARVVAAMPATVVKVAESGVQDAADVRTLQAAGFEAVLVGESVVTAADPEAAVRALRDTTG